MYLTWELGRRQAKPSQAPSAKVSGTGMMHCTLMLEHGNCISNATTVGIRGNLCLM
jgi:hypothetical protein